MFQSRGVVILVGLAMALLSVNGAVAKSETYQGKLVGPVPDTGQYDDCYQWSQCQELRGIAIKDFDVSELPIDGDSGYNLYDLSWSSLITTWHLCSYDVSDGDVTRLDCDWNLYSPYKKGGDLPQETDLIRIIVENGASPEYYFKIFP